MADQTANLTLTLTDEMSDKLAAIENNLDRLRQRMKVTGQDSADPLRRLKEEFQQITEHTNKLSSSLQILGSFSKSYLIEFSANLGKSTEKMHGLAGMTGTAANVTAGLARGLTGVAGGFAAIATAGIAAAGGAVVLSQQMTRAFQSAENFRRSLGELTDANIRGQSRLMETMGLTADQAKQIMSSGSQLMRDVSRGYQAEIFKMLSSHRGFEGIWDRAFDRFKQGMEPLKAFNEFILDLAKGSAEFQRQIEQQRGWPAGFIAEWARQLKDFKPPFAMTPAEFAAYQKQMEAMKHSVDTLTHAIEDDMGKAWVKMQMAAAPVLTWMTDKLKEMYDWSKKAVPDWFSKGMRGFEGPGEQPAPEDRKNAPKNLPDWLERGLHGFRGAGEEPAGNEQIYQFEGGGGGRRRGYKFRPDLEWAEQLHGGYSKNIENRVQEEIRDKGREGTTYLREIRDIMSWMRDQQGMAGAGGGAGGPGLGGYAGGGGGAVTQRRTGAPWYGPRRRPAGGTSGLGEPEAPAWPPPLRPEGYYVDKGWRPPEGVPWPKSPLGGADGAKPSPLPEGIQWPKSPFGGADAVPEGPGPSKTSNAPDAGMSLSRERFDAMFKGSPLEGQYATVLSEAAKNNVPPSLFAAIMAFESGRGTSKATRQFFNPAGLMDPRTGSRTKLRFPTIEEGIAASARTVGKHYARAGDDLVKFAHGPGGYSPLGAANDPKNTNRLWPSYVAKFREQLSETQTLPTARDVPAGAPEWLGGAVMTTRGGGPPVGRGRGDLAQQYNFFQSQGMKQLSAKELTRLDTPYGSILAHPQAAGDVSGFFSALAEAGAPIKGLGSYNPRPKRWGGGPSSHGYGTAFDIDDQVQLSPAMKNWIAQDPSRWESLKEKFNVGQPLPGKDPAHIEWRGPRPQERGAFTGGVPYLEGSRRFGADLPAAAERAPEEERPSVPYLAGSRAFGRDRASEDRSWASGIMNGGSLGKGSIDINVKAPRGTKVGADGDGVFEKMTIKQTPQMGEAEPAVNEEE